MPLQEVKNAFTREKHANRLDNVISICYHDYITIYRDVVEEGLDGETILCVCALTALCKEKESLYAS
jgi:hypothetical protein